MAVNGAPGVVSPVAEPAGALMLDPARRRRAGKVRTVYPDGFEAFAVEPALVLPLFGPTRAKRLRELLAYAR